MSGKSEQISTEEKLKELYEIVENQYKCFSILRYKRHAYANLYTTFVQNEIKLRTLFEILIDNIIIKHLNGNCQDVSADINSATREFLESIQKCISIDQERIKQEVDEMERSESTLSDIEYNTRESDDIYKEVLSNLKTLTHLDEKLFDLESSINSTKTYDEDMVSCNVKALLQKLSAIYRYSKDNVCT
ncbi:unnamed protein product [Rhizopus stolonifer]